MNFFYNNIISYDKGCLFLFLPCSLNEIHLWRVFTGVVYCDEMGPHFYRVPHRGPIFKKYYGLGTPASVKTQSVR